MKWWGWGHESVEFDMASRPALLTYACKNLRLEKEPPLVPRVAFDDIQLPEQRLEPAFLRAAREIEGAPRIADDKLSRLTHALGKSCRDLWRMRRGILTYAPDVVIYPESHSQVRELVDLASRHRVCLIPFGGGSNVAGCLEPAEPADRMVVSLDMRRMDRLLALDRESGVARIEAGAPGPVAEEQLNREGFTLGHFPDSFLHSTVGGWVATRSAGMQSDRYGKIEDMVVSIRMAAPAGDLETLTVPRASDGIDMNRICIGSEGTLGVITEITFQVHPLPERKNTYAWLFRDFETGVRAMRECRLERTRPSMIRLNDPAKTALSAAFPKTPPRWKRLLSRAVKGYIRNVRRWQPENVCLMLVGFEDTAARFDRGRKVAEAIFRRHGAIPLGDAPGKSFNEGKFDFPYLRDYFFDRGILCDVSETATTWSNLLPLHRAATAAMEKAFAAENTAGWVSCHVSHSYHAGASLYFTFAYVANAPDELVQFLRIKKAGLDAFVENGATVSHHHAIGYEHMPWLEKIVSAPGVEALRSLKQGLDPENVMNPGRLTGGLSFDKWSRIGR
jgi:alkyldihydroxyacetonephosphate synthase